jgi:hypothetical protein
MAWSIINHAISGPPKAVYRLADFSRVISVPYVRPKQFQPRQLVVDLFFSLIIMAGAITTFRPRWVHFFPIFLSVTSLSIALNDKEIPMQ